MHSQSSNTAQRVFTVRLSEQRSASRTNALEKSPFGFFFIFSYLERRSFV